MNKIKKISKQQGSHNTTKLFVSKFSYSPKLSRKIAKAISDFAIQESIDVIVFEHLEFKGKVKGNKKQLLHLWRKQTIQKIIEHKVHRNGIRVNRICAYNTSKLAFDGSGKVTRDSSNYSLCTFSNGKQYNCDLSASYNIGARYFIKEIIKTISVKKWSDIQAKVPECQKRTLCTYNTLKQINQYSK